MGAVCSLVCCSQPSRTLLQVATDALQAQWEAACKVKAACALQGKHCTVAEACGAPAQSVPHDVAAVCARLADGRTLCPAVLLKVVDGDTLSVLLPVAGTEDAGKAPRVLVLPCSVRVAGIDAPEMSKAYIPSSVNALFNAKGATMHSAGVVARAAAVQYLGGPGLLPHPCYDDSEWTGAATDVPRIPLDAVPREERVATPTVWLSWEAAPRHAAGAAGGATHCKSSPGTPDAHSATHLLQPLRLDRYSRLLADVWVSTSEQLPPAGKPSLASFLLQQELVVPYNGRGKREFSLSAARMVVQRGRLARERGSFHTPP